MKGFMWVVGIASLVYGIYFLMQDTSNWPKVEAVVTSSRAGTTDDTGNTSYQTSFDYEVNGVKFTSTINDYKQYTKGDTLTVYYDPKDPTTTISSKGELGTTGCIGVVFGLICLVGMTWGVIKSRRKTDTPAEETNSPSQPGG